MARTRARCNRKQSTAQGRKRKHTIATCGPSGSCLPVIRRGASPRVTRYSVCRSRACWISVAAPVRSFCRFSRTPARLGVGIDVSPEVGLAGRSLFATAQCGSRVAFVRAAAESLPIATSSVDVVICRLALPYTDNTRAIAEMARVLRPDGRLLLKFHHARYYTARLRHALAARTLKPAIHACRALIAGGLYHLTGSQPRGRLTGGETFQTLWLLRRELSRHGLVVRGALVDSAPSAPSVLVVRERSL